MPTGFEEAGLVLAIWPVLVGALQFYAEEEGVIKNWWYFKEHLYRFIADLEREQVTFENTCRLLLNDMVQNTGLDVDVDLLLQKPGGDEWKNEAFKVIAREYFFEKMARVYVDSVIEMSEILHKIQRKLGISEDDKPLEFLDKKTRHRQWKRITLAVTADEMKNHLARASSINSFLIGHIGQKRFTPSTQQFATPCSKFYKQIRQHAIDIYNILNSRFLSTCQCAIPHNANLRLVHRKAHSDPRDVMFNVVFSFEELPTSIPTPPWKWQEMEIQPLGYEPDCSQTPNAPVHTAILTSPLSFPPPPAGMQHKQAVRPSAKHAISSIFRVNLGSAKGSSTSEQTADATSAATLKPILTPIEKRSALKRSKPSKTASVKFGATPVVAGQSQGLARDHGRCSAIAEKVIEDLCFAIREASSGSPLRGLLIAETSPHQRIRIRAAESPLVMIDQVQVISLEALLAPNAPLRLTFKERLKIGLDLASAVMQLHGTQWLTGSWGKKDIFFFQKDDGTIIAQSPLVCRTFTSTTLPTSQTSQTPQKQLFKIQIPDLFALGIILIELWYGKRLEDLGDANEQGDLNLQTLLTAQHMLDKMVLEEATEAYGNAVTCCIKGPHDINPAFATLDDDKLGDAIGQNVLVPLEETLSFWGISGINNPMK